MERIFKSLGVIAIVIFIALPAFAQDGIAKKMNDVLIRGVEEGHWQVTADEVYMWIKTKQKDFIVVDVRPKEKAYKAGHVPGAMHIPYNEILSPANLKRLPKGTKVILVCATGQLQNIPLLPLRVLGYDAYTMAFGYAAWEKGSMGGEQIKTAIKRADSKNYPMEK